MGRSFAAKKRKIRRIKISVDIAIFVANELHVTRIDITHFAKKDKKWWSLADSNR
jgi:hypothetical protein